MSERTSGSPQILFSTGNVGLASDDFTGMFHSDPELLGQHVADAGFDGVTLCPQGNFKEPDFLIRAVQSGNLVISSLMQDCAGFDVQHGTPDNAAEEKIRASSDLKYRHLPWRESLAYFFELQREIGKLPITINSRVERDDDKVTQFIIEAESYAVSPHNALAAYWQVKTVDELVQEVGIRGFAGLSFDMHQASHIAAPVYKNGQLVSAVSSRVVSDAVNDPESFTLLGEATVEVCIPLMKNREKYGFSDARGLADVVTMLREHRLPDSLQSVAQTMSPERVILDLRTHDLMKAIVAARESKEGTDYDMAALWRGYQAIGQVLRQEFTTAN